MCSKIESLKKSIEIVNDALDKGAYSAAFFCALSLPDICSQIEYKENKGKKQLYIKWYDEFIFSFEDLKYNSDEKWDHFRKSNKINGEFIYLLRCKLYHEGELYHEELKQLLNNEFKKDYENQKMKIEIDLNAEIDSFGYFGSDKKCDDVHIKIRVNQKMLTKKLVWNAEGVIRKVEKGAINSEDTQN